MTCSIILPSHDVFYVSYLFLFCRYVVGPKNVASRDMISASSSAAITPKTSAKVLIPAKTKGTDLDDASGKSSSSSPGDVL